MSTNRQKSSASTPAKPKGSTFTQELADRICERLATTELGIEEVLEEIRAETGYAPDQSTVWRWRKANEQFRQDEIEARQRQAQLLHDRAQKYAREPLIGRIEKTVITAKGQETTVTVSDNVERSKLLVQTTLKRAGQLDSKKFGEKIQQEVSGPGGGPVQAEVKVTFVKPKPEPTS